MLGAMQKAVDAIGKTKHAPKAMRFAAIIYAARVHFEINYPAMARHFKVDHDVVFDAYCAGIAHLENEPVFPHLVYHARQAAARA